MARRRFIQFEDFYNILLLIHESATQTLFVLKLDLVGAVSVVVQYLIIGGYGSWTGGTLCQSLNMQNLFDSTWYVYVEVLGDYVRVGQQHMAYQPLRAEA